MRRRDIHQLGGEVLLREQFDTQTLPPHADWDQLYPGSLESGASPDVARIFYDCNIAGVGQHASGKVNCLLRPIDDNDLASMTAHSSRRSDISGDRLTQPQKTGGVTMDRDLSGRLSAMSSKQPAPQVQR